ncbi:MAG: radical SAM protein, partial [Candidatus Sulfotelmatobacter sp.]
GKSVKLSSTEHHLVLKDEIVTNEVQHDLEQLGIAKNAREEKLRARDERLRLEEEENIRMAKLYREFVLKEQPAPKLVQIGVQATAPPAEADREPVGSGD